MDMNRYIRDKLDPNRGCTFNRPLPEKQEHNYLIKMRELMLDGLTVRRVIHEEGCAALGWIVDDRETGTRVRMSGWCRCEPTFILSDGSRI